ncbi:MAG TPA: cation diffusion facilitator family transporter [Candidatus Omnitrophota bacterium]|nr:cation diffusion facilitator family transporter [Candidatus Omnitrophota bacterium]
MTQENDLYFKNIRQVLIIVLVFNWLVALAKIIFGFISRSSSMSADGFHSLSDGASNIIGLIGITLAAQPKDKEHPYGHKKFETFFSLGIAFLLGIVCVELLQTGFRRIYHPVIPHINGQIFFVMVMTLFVNIFVMRYERREGQRLKSDILISDAMHTKADILTSLSVLVTFVAVQKGFIIIDAIVTVVIALFIGYAAYKIIKDASFVLCDKVVITDIKAIEDIVLQTKGVRSCHKIRSHGRSDDIHLDLHVQMKPNNSLNTVHEISHDIEQAIKKAMPEVTEVMIHMEPSK